jgi:branched-chain amino acid transport system ATP-binding protein
MLARSKSYFLLRGQRAVEDVLSWFLTWRLYREVEAKNIAIAQKPAFDRERGLSPRPDAFNRSVQKPARALKLRGVCKQFAGVQAIVDVDMEVSQGELHAVIGPNGAGKSTLLNLISGLYAADAGTISIDGSTRSPKARDLARLGIARTFQNLALFEGLDVAQNIAMGRRCLRRSGVAKQILGLPRARRERRETRRLVEDMLAFFELEAFAHRRLDGLPYGVLKRIELARAIVFEPHLLLLDEPLAGMNGSDKTEMARLIRSTRDRFGTTIVLIEHDVEIVMGLADRITVLDYGRKIADGTPGEIRRHPAVVAAYLGQNLEEEAA